MVSFKSIALYLIVSLFTMNMLFPNPVLCKDAEQDLLHDINIYRTVMNLPILKEQQKMSCLAEKVADDLDNKNKCQDFDNYYPVPGTSTKIPYLEESIKKCKININTTKDGVIMPVCVKKLDHDALFSNYTKSNRFRKYLNSSKYTVAGIGAEDDWMVLIVSTNKAYSGDFSSATSSLLGGAYCKVLVLLLFLAAIALL